MIKCKRCDFVSSSISENANHNRWHHYTEDTSSKFLRAICCLQCKIETTVQSFKAHINKHDIVSNFGSCLHCGRVLTNKTKFCTRSCAAHYSNARKDYTKFKPGPKPNIIPKITKVKQCVICNTFHPRKGKTCGEKCKLKLMSLKANERIDNGWNPQEHRCRSRPSFLEKSFEDWLISIKFNNYIKNKTFRCGEKIYFGDFFFPEKGILIELDGKQHQQSREYDEMRDVNIQRFYGVKTIRISYEEYMKKSQIDVILKALK